MFIYKDLLIFIVGIGVIIKSADLFIQGAEGIGRTFKIPRIVVGATIVSLATTAPEFSVSAISSYMGVGGVAVGNAVGSCLANIGLILALAAIIRPLKFSAKIFRYELPFLIAALLILYLFFFDNTLNRIDGLSLVLFLVIFFLVLILRELDGIKKDNEDRAEKFPGQSLKKDIIKFLIGAVGVVASSKYAIVPSAINIASFLNIPEIVIGVSMVAIGTSLPELFTAIVASVKNMGELAVGNVIGANILNILWVLGGASLIRPLDIDVQTKILTMPVLFLITLSMFLFSRTKFKLTRLEGAILFAIYLGYIFYIFRFAYS